MKADEARAAAHAYWRARRFEERRALRKLKTHVSEGLIGAAEGTRTPDPLITNEVLYQLSYRGIRSIDPDPLIPAQAGIQGQELGPRFRGDERVSDPISLAPEYRYAPKTART